VDTVVRKRMRKRGQAKRKGKEEKREVPCVDTFFCVWSCFVFPHLKTMACIFTVIQQNV